MLWMCFFVVSMKEAYMYFMYFGVAFIPDWRPWIAGSKSYEGNIVQLIIFSGLSFGSKIEHMGAS